MSIVPAQKKHIHANDVVPQQLSAVVITIGTLLLWLAFLMVHVTLTADWMNPRGGWLDESVCSLLRPFLVGKLLGCIISEFPDPLVLCVFTLVYLRVAEQYPGCSLVRGRAVFHQGAVFRKSYKGAPHSARQGFW